MEEQKDMNGMLEMMTQPAFLVKSGVITAVNQAARQLLIEADTSVEPLLGQHMQDYSDFTNGCLCLTLTVSGCLQQASVTRMSDFDVFVVDQMAGQAQLQAMSLTAMTLREPLSDIMAITDQLFGDSPQDQNPQAQARLCHMNRRLSQLHRIVCNMTDAISYAGSTPPRMVCQDICAVVEEIFEHAGTLITESGFRFSYSGPQQSVFCMVSADRLERAIYNMLSNSMKNAAPGSLIEATLTHRGNRMYLSVQDDGSGIPVHLRSSVCTRYLRQPGIEGPSSGLGLGMVLVRGAAAAHGGTVLIDQPNEKGVRITMSLAIRPCQSTTIRSNTLRVDYAGKRDHGLLELSDVLPPEFYAKN